MKKIFKLIAIVVIILILGILTLFCSKVGKISLIEKIKQKIAKTEEIETVNGVTRIDITNLKDSGIIEHEHILKKMNDEKKHWNECTICGKKENVENHEYADNGWTMGNSCSEKNVHKFNCACGYGYETTEQRTPHNLLMNDTEVFTGFDWCSVCHAHLNRHNCAKSDGSRINCLNLGTCVVNGHGYTYTKSDFKARHSGDNINSIDLNQICCNYCNSYLGKVNYNYIEKISDTVFKHYSSVTVADNVKYDIMSQDSYFGGNSRIKNDSTSVNGTTWSQVNTITITAHTESVGTVASFYYGKINGSSCQISVNKACKIDTISPTISNITQDNNEELTEWSKTKPILVSGTENYCNTVKVKIINENEETVFEGDTKVANNNYSISCIPEVETDINGKTFKVIVIDSLENSIQQEFVIAKVDCVPPKPISSNDITGDWAKSRKFTFKATDYGIGGVSIAFNDIDDLGLANFDDSEYNRDYEFYGDVYKPKQLSVLYKDGLGNISIQKVTIEKLDNTAPTIVSATIHNNIVTVDANDRHEQLGEGSGIVKYRYITSEEELNNIDISKGIESTSNKFIVDNVYKVKYIYIAVEDMVGNVSDVYELRVPKLILTSSIDLSLANGKCGVILDWSTYDVDDKYFIIYRKEENAVDWETIVSLDKKLNGSKYTDKLGNDKFKPDIPNISITGDTLNNNVKVEATSNDNGTKYTYYIEAYDDNNKLIAVSNEI